MKKLLTAFAAFGMMATTTATAMTVVSCGTEAASITLEQLMGYHNKYKDMTFKELSDIAENLYYKFAIYAL